MVRIRIVTRALKLAAVAATLVALAPVVVHAAPLQRLTVSSFTLSADTANPQLEVPFHLVISLHVRETVPQIDNINLPVLVDVELLGDERATQAGPGGTDYRETITVVAHHTGRIDLQPATLQAIDARDGKAKQYFTNALTLNVSGGTLAPATGPSLNDMFAQFGETMRGLVFWIAGLAALVLLVLLLARRPARATPVVVAATPPPPPRALPMRSTRDRLQDALTVLRAERTREAAVRVRGAVWEAFGASSGETLADVLQRPQARDERVAALLRALERAAFTYDEDLALAIDGACGALERYLA